MANDSGDGSSGERIRLADGGDATGDGSKSSPKDTMESRVEGSRWKLWVLFDADRRLLAALLSLSVFVAVVAASVLDIAPMRRVISQQTALWWVFSPLIGAIITGVTLVVTFTQLVISQELGPLGDQRERMSGAMEFRKDVESWLEVSPTPPDPSSFLEALVDGVQVYADDLRDAAERNEDAAARQQIDDFVASLSEQAEVVGGGLQGSTFGEFDVLYTALDFNYSWKIYEAKRLREEHADALDEETVAAIDDLVKVLEFFGPAREHFKTLYFRWELVNLSRAIIYASLPALAVSLAGVLYLAPSSFPRATLGVDNVVWFVSAATTLSVLPFLVLVTYVLRIATIAKRTLAVGPFVLRESERSGGDE